MTAMMVVAELTYSTENLPCKSPRENSARFRTSSPKPHALITVSMATASPSVVVVPYDPHWPVQFERLRSLLWTVLSDIALSVEHVGSTSVPGLAAKPLIDIDVVIPSPGALPLVVERLAALGYEHRGDLGIEGRDAFRTPADSPHRHNLYVCPQGSLGLRNHIMVRQYLRSHADKAKEYGELKLQLAKRFPHDINSYVDGKTDLILSVLRSSELSGDELARIELANRKP
jgi:GrpB-like predicted nucleotidyltransferase (UPF0157 family)